MPSKSKKQARTMTAACKNSKFRKKIGIPKKVACKFHKHDKGKYHESVVDEDKLSPDQLKLAADIIEKSPTLMDFLRDPEKSYKDFLAAKDELNQQLETENGVIKENFRPPTFLQVNKRLVEIQLGWDDREKNIARGKVFVDGKRIGKYYFSGTDYKVDDKMFETVEEAIAYLISKRK